jgi:hypothetical protein
MSGEGLEVRFRPEVPVFPGVRNHGAWLPA